MWNRWGASPDGSLTLAAMLAVGLAAVGVPGCDPAGQTGTDAMPPASCGNGVVDLFEACDDGNTMSGDGCRFDCTSTEICGNGFNDDTELCDDGNTNDGDGCSANCLSLEVCGNSVVDVAVGEECDDGNTVDGDSCSSTCARADLPVNDTAPGDQGHAVSLALPAGGFLVVWEDDVGGGGGVRGRLFDAKGASRLSGLSPGDGDFPIPTAGTEARDPDVALSVDRILVVWREESVPEVRGRLLAVNGVALPNPQSPAGDEMILSTGVVAGGKVAVAGTGTLFAVVHEDVTGGLTASWYDPNAAALDAMSLDVALDLGGAPASSPDAVLGADGTLLVTFLQQGEARAAAFPTPGSPTSNGIRILGPADHVRVSRHPVSGFVATWASSGAAEALLLSGIDATPIGGSVAADPLIPVGAVPASSISVATSGALLVYVAADDTDDTGIAATLFDASLGSLGLAPQIINGNTPGAQGSPLALALNDGRFVVLWESAAGSVADASGVALLARIVFPEDFMP